MGSHKDRFGKTRVGMFLSEKAPNILDMVGDFLPDSGALGIVKKLIDSDDSLSSKDKATAQDMIDAELKHIELIMHDKQNARKMQMIALQQDDKFSKRFTYYLASFWSLVSAAYFFMVTFSEVLNERVSDTVLGFMLGTIVAKILSFFYGSSKGSKDKQEHLNKMK